jgi:hypothetical protein
MNKLALTREDLVHDFEGDLHAIISTVEQVRENLTQDPNYCQTVIQLACQRGDQLLEKWKKLKVELKEEDC